MNRKVDYEKLLQGAGLKPTKRRLLILSLLGVMKKPVTAPEIYAMAKERTAIDRVTVYRILEGLFEAGLLDRLKSGKRAHSYHLVAGPDRLGHPHFFCTACGASSCLDPCVIRLDKKRLQELFPAQVDHLEITLEGVCPHCLKKKKESSND